MFSDDVFILIDPRCFELTSLDKFNSIELDCQEKNCELWTTDCSNEPIRPSTQIAQPSEHPVLICQSTCPDRQRNSS